MVVLLILNGLGEGKLEMTQQAVECKVCKNIGKSQLKGSTWISFVLFWFFAMIPGIIYMIWRRGGSGVCRFCGSEHVAPYHGKRTKVIQQDALAQTVIMQEPESTNVQQVQCPDCREYIRYDARKCKHCGSMVGQA